MTVDSEALTVLLTGDVGELARLVGDLPGGCRAQIRDRAALVADIADDRNRCPRCGRWAPATGRENALNPYRWHSACRDADLEERARWDPRARALLFLIRRSVV